jgi:hypothetical protein
MVEPTESNSDPTITDRQIIKRFQLLFGRDMTPQERKAFFMPDDEGPTLKTKEEK